MVIRLIGQIRYAFFIVLVACISVILVMAFVNKNQRSSLFLFMPRPDADIQKDLEHALEAVVLNNRARVVHDGIMQQFPGIESLTIATSAHPQRSRIVMIQQEKPYFLVNDAIVMTVHEHAVPKKMYPVGLQETMLPVASDSLDENEMHNLFVFIKSLPADVLENYSIIWRNKTLVELRHTMMHYVIKATSTTSFDGPTLQAIAVLAQYIETKKDCVKNKTAQWVMDVRCRNKIILARQKGE